MLTYLASPYSHESAAVRSKRFIEACIFASKLMRKGVMVFSPIAHTHPIAKYGELPKGLDFWEKYDREIISHCGCLIVLKLQGWEESKGVSAEIAIAKELGIEVKYMEPYE